jgi:hypothetical protein
MRTIKPLKGVELFQPIEFWSDLIKILDGRVKQTAEVYGFGEVRLKLVIRGGMIRDVVFSEEVSVRQNEKVQKNAREQARVSKKS